MESLYPILGYAVRVALGLGLSLSLGLGFIMVGRGLYVLSGSYSWTVWLWVMLTVAGMGAALGGYLAWLTAGAPRPATASLVMLVAIALLAVAGAWAGYQWGSTQEVPCCVKPRTSSAGYAVHGAMVSANAASIALALFSQVRWKLPSPPYHGEGLGRSPATPIR